MGSNPIGVTKENSAEQSAFFVAYILQTPEGFSLPTSAMYPVGIIFAIVGVALFMKATVMRKNA